MDEEAHETLDQRRLNRHNSSESIDCAATPEKPEEPMQVEGTEVGVSPGDVKGPEQSGEFVRPPADHNLFYRLFSIGSCGEPQNELMKNKVEKAYKLLVRTKSDGAIVGNFSFVIFNRSQSVGMIFDNLSTQRLVGGEQQMMMVAPKLEHQLDMGAEAVTAEEAAKQWMSLTFRPDTCLTRGM